MRRAILALLLLVASPALAAIEPVQDDAGLLTRAEIGQLRSKLLAHRSASDVNIVVAIVTSLHDRSIEEVAIDRFRALGIGRAREDNGLLLLVAPTERKVRVEVGYGMEGEVTDVDATAVIDAMRPALQSAAWNAALTTGVDELIARTAGHQPKAGFPAADFFPNLLWLLAALIPGAVVPIVMISHRRREQDRAWRAENARLATHFAEPSPTYYGRPAARSHSSGGNYSRSSSRRDDDSLSASIGAGLGSSSGSSTYSDSSSGSGSFSDSGGSSGGGGSSGDF